MSWYRVTKTINGCKYLYLQTTWREGGKVKTKNKYIGPLSPAGPYSPEPRQQAAISKDLEEARVRRDILEDVLRSHPVKFFLKFRGRTDQQQVGGTSFAELNARALRTGAKGKHLDTYLSEHGFASFEDLDTAVEQYFETTTEFKAAKAALAKLRKEQAYARAYHRALGMRPNRPSKNIEEFDAPRPESDTQPPEPEKAIPTPAIRPKRLKPTRIKLDKIRRLKPRPRWTATARAEREHRQQLRKDALANAIELNRLRRQWKKKTAFARLFAFKERRQLNELQQAQQHHARYYLTRFGARLRLKSRR